MSCHSEVASWSAPFAGSRPQRLADWLEIGLSAHLCSHLLLFQFSTTRFTELKQLSRLMGSIKQPVVPSTLMLMLMLFSFLLSLYHYSYCCYTCCHSSCRHWSGARASGPNSRWLLSSGLAVGVTFTHARRAAKLKMQESSTNQIVSSHPPLLTILLLPLFLLLYSSPLISSSPAWSCLGKSCRCRASSLRRVKQQQQHKFKRISRIQQSLELWAAF